MDRARSSAALTSYPRSIELTDPDLRVLARAGGENFPVASRLLPRRYRNHLMAVYGFARLVDDTGDEAPPAERLRLLDVIEDDLHRVYAATPRLPVLREMDHTVKACGVPVDPLRDLIQANRQDQRVSRYDDYAELLGYCTLSANPVGRIVLYVFAAATPQRFRLADRVCTALQLIEHWQDVAEDFARGRVYVPQEDLERFGCAEPELAEAPASKRVQKLMAFEVDRAAELLDTGAPLIGTLRGFARLAVAGYVAGGRAAVAAIRAAGYDVTAAAPKPRRVRLVVEWLRAVVRGR